MARILVIDDDKVTRSLLQELLNESGHIVELAEEAKEGLAKLKESGFDLCICDLHLRAGSAYQILAEFESGGRQIPFIFTDSLPSDLVEDIHSTPEHFYLRKPFDLGHVREILDQAMSRSKVK